MSDQRDDGFAHIRKMMEEHAASGKSFERALVEAIMGAESAFRDNKKDSPYTRDSSSQDSSLSETPSPEAAAEPQLRVKDALETIDKLAALLPEEQREAFKAKVKAMFEAAAGVTARADVTRASKDARDHPKSADARLRVDNQSAPPPQSHKEKLAAAKKLITGKLPSLFARKRARHKPGKPSIADEARRITSQYERDNKKMIFDEQAMAFVQAAYVIVNANKPKSQTVKKPKATPPSAIRHQ